MTLGLCARVADRHSDEAGGMRRVHLRGRDNILKPLLVLSLPLDQCRTGDIEDEGFSLPCDQEETCDGSDECDSVAIAIQGLTLIYWSVCLKQLSNMNDLDCFYLPISRSSWLKCSFRFTAELRSP